MFQYQYTNSLKLALLWDILSKHISNSRIYQLLPGMVMHIFNPHTHKAEAGRSVDLSAQIQSTLYSEFQSSQGYMVRPCLNNNNKRSSCTDHSVQTRSHPKVNKQFEQVLCLSWRQRTLLVFHSSWGLFIWIIIIKFSVFFSPNTIQQKHKSEQSHVNCCFLFVCLFVYARHRTRNALYQ